tara:strand:+ start:7614 stop:8765 length:1152 start_codon:yes stop_codon:yes gene_type:complete
MNTLTNLIPDLYAGLDTVSRELTGFIPSVARSSTAERAAVGEAVRYPIAPTNSTSNIAPAMTVPEPTDQTIGSDTITITKSKVAEFGFVGEEQRGLNNGPGYMTVQADMIAQAIRAVVNEMENDLAAAAVAGASRAAGTAGTTPFATNMAALFQARKVLVDNGSPESELRAVLNTSAGANFRTLHSINSDRDYSQMPMSEQGVLMTSGGMQIRETGQDQPHTAGTGASATTDTAGYAVGATTITLASAGTGTILTGDVITFAGDSEQYVVLTGDGDVSDGGSITIAAPGLRKAIPASATEITVVDSYNPNVVFHRNAIQLVTRAPEVPQEGDMAIDSMMITDPRSGLALEARVYPGYRKMRYEIGAAWGWKTIKSEHCALLLG